MMNNNKTNNNNNIEEEEEEGGRERKRRRRRRCDEESQSPDRLSHLPESILCHILSFLDTKSAVQTSVLSRQWRCTWKYVAVLNLHQESFKGHANFQGYVDKVLSLRSSLIHATKISYIGPLLEYASIPVRVVEYALSHGTQHLEIDMNMKREYLPLSRVLQYVHVQSTPLVLSGSNSSLKTLHLRRGVLVHDSYCWGFRGVTTLKLDCCLLLTDQDGVVDPFSNFPCLKSLALSTCRTGVDNRIDPSIRVSGLQLQSLELTSTYVKVEVYAPKLESIAVDYLIKLQVEEELALPCLERAHISTTTFREERLIPGGLNTEERISWRSTFEFRVLLLTALFQRLHNVKSLTLHPAIADTLNHLSLKALKHFKPFPFTKLEKLIILPSCSYNLPSTLVKHFFNGSNFATSSSNSSTSTQFVRA